MIKDGCEFKFFIKVLRFMSYVFISLLSLLVNFFKVMGITPSTNLDAINEVCDEAEDETWIGGVSALSLNCDEDWCDDEMNCNEVDDLASAIVGKKSVVSRPRAVVKGVGLRDSVIYTNQSFILDYILSVWPDINLNKRVSVQFCVESGKNAHKQYLIRVSQDGLSLVIERELTEVATSAPLALLTQFVPSDEKDVNGYIINLMREHPLIKIHPKFLGYNQAIASITSRSKNKVKKQCRIPLPIRCRHTYAVKEDSDDFFLERNLLVTLMGLCGVT